MRAWGLLLLGLLLLPAAASGVPQAACPDVKDPSLLPSPSLGLAAAQAHGLDVRLATLPERIAQLPAPPLGTQAVVDDCAGRIRPGAELILNKEFLCTANWVFEDEKGALYLGTAGHCIPDATFTDIEIPGLGPIGTPAFSTGDAGIGNDFALIRIDPSMYGLVSTTLCHWGGPRGVSDDSDFGAGPVVVLHYGNGNVYGDAAPTRPRVGVTHAAELDANSFEFEGLIAPGDSGSAIELSNGQALGLITHGTIVPQAEVGAGVGLGTRIGRALQLAHDGTGHTFTVLDGKPVDLTGLST